MIATASWICLLAPLSAALLITLAGTHISRTLAAWISILSTFVGFAGAVAPSPRSSARTTNRETPLDRLPGSRRELTVDADLGRRSR
jgi:hypothetical protein